MQLVFVFLAGIVVTLIAIVVIASVNADVSFFAKINANLATFQAIGSLAIAYSAIVAFFLYRLNLNRHKDEDAYKSSNTFLKEATNNLERAFEIFTDNGKNITPPRNDRLLWLTTARMILRFNKLRSRITKTEHIDIVDEHEEYWRFQFYKLLDENKSNFTKTYFNPSGKPHSGDCIARNSMAVIFSFVRWKEGAKDPMKEVDDKLLFAKGAIPIDQFGAIEFLEDYKKYWGEVEELKKKVNNDS
tara:strand:+ start:3110 stop:3844 length:735 start_codon:yes stop_codon:yes gene_type:complete